MTDSPLNAALRPFEATEANLTKAEKLLEHIRTLIPRGVSFGDNPEYETASRNFSALLAALPKIDDWKPEIYIYELNEIAQNRMDAQEVGEFEARISVELEIDEPRSSSENTAIASTKNAES